MCRDWHEVQVRQVADVSERLPAVEQGVDPECLRCMANERDAGGACGLVQRTVRMERQAGRRVEQLMKLDDVVSRRRLPGDLCAHLVRGLKARFVDEWSRRVERWASQRPVGDPAPPFELGWRAAEIEDRRDSVREIEWSLTKVVPRRC